MLAPLCGEKQAGRRLTFGFAGVYRRGQTGWASSPPIGVWANGHWILVSRRKEGLRVHGQYQVGPEGRPQDRTPDRGEQVASQPDADFRSQSRRGNRRQGRVRRRDRPARRRAAGRPRRAEGHHAQERRLAEDFSADEARQGAGELRETRFPRRTIPTIPTMAATPGRAKRSPRPTSRPIVSASIPRARFTTK